MHYSRLENTHESRNLCNQLCINENDNERNCDPNSSCGALKRIENTNERSRCFWFNASRAVRVTRTPFSFTGEEYSSGFDLETMRSEGSEDIERFSTKQYLCNSFVFLKISFIFECITTCNFIMLPSICN